jgi:antirestriction protein ArdC
MNEKVRQAIESIVQRFKEGDIPKAIAYSMFPIPNTPSSKWSLLNRTLMFIYGTSDARGFRQWKEAGRYVKKGSKSFTILAPRFVKKQDEDEEETEPILAGFLPVPVFRVEDTEGEALDYQEIELPGLPLMEVAQEWGISVKAVPGNYHYSGYFSQDRKEIGLASKEETVFFHELAHAAHQRILGELKKGQDWKQEIVAELAAATLCKIVRKTSKHLGNSYRYIEEYAKSAHLTPWQGCLKVISDTEKVLNLILDWKSPKKVATPRIDEALSIDRKATERESQNKPLRQLQIR